MRTLGADGFADSGQSYPGHAYRDALDVARARGVPLLEPRAGDVWRTADGVTLRFYAPSLPYICGTRNDTTAGAASRGSRQAPVPSYRVQHHRACRDRDLLAPPERSRLQTWILARFDVSGYPHRQFEDRGG